MKEYIVAKIFFKDTPDIHEEVIIKTNTNVIEKEDNKIFYYCNGFDEVKQLMEYDNGEDFVIEEWGYITLV